MIIELMTISAAAREYDIPRSRLTTRVTSGRIQGYRVKGILYVRAKDLDEYRERVAVGHRGPNFLVVKAGHGEGKSDYAMARELGLSRERIRQIRGKLGLPKNPRRRQVAQ
jgi:hypothetical protein